MSSSSILPSKHSDAQVHPRVANKLHVIYCYDTIMHRLNGKENHPPVKHTWSGEKFPLFVTWKKPISDTSSEWKLRGCIGTFSAKELSIGLREYALISAFEDSRFSPITKSEVARLRCDISLLTRFETIGPQGDLHDWQIGTHGVTLEFEDPSTSRSYHATFLPEVALEQNWTKEETIDELVHKSGFRGKMNQAIRHKMKLTRYQSEKESLKYDEFVALRAQVTAAASSEAAAAEAADDEDEDDDDEDSMRDSSSSPPATQQTRSKVHINAAASSTSSRR